MPGNADTLRAVYDAFGKGDIDGWFALMDPAIGWTEPAELPYGGTHHGHDGLRELAGRWAGVYREMAVDPREFHESGDTVLVIGRYRFTTHAGQPVHADFVQVWDRRDGKAVRDRDDTEKAAKLERALAAAAVPAD